MTVTLDINPAFSRQVGEGGRLVGYNHADSVSILYFSSDLGPAEKTWDVSHEKYEELRQAQPTLELPELKPRKPGTNANGNTLGAVVGETPSTAGKATQANPEVKPETPKEEGWWSSWGSSVVHTVLDVGGAIPVVGIFSDGINAGIYAAEGDMVNAAISGVSAAANLIPGGGAAAKAGKLAYAGGKMALKEAEKEVAEGIAKKTAREVEEATVKKTGKDAETGGGGSKNSDTQVKKKVKPKPKCGQQGPYKDRNNHDNAGMNWDHVPSQAALLKAARQTKGEALSPGEVKAIVDNAPTIAIPTQLHQKHSETYGGRQHQSIDGVKRPARDASDLQRAAKENTDKILDTIDKYDPGCKEAYRDAARKITDMTNDDWKKWLKKTMKSASED